MTYPVAVYSIDWHPRNHVSFVSNVNTREFRPISLVGPEPQVGADINKADKDNLNINQSSYLSEVYDIVEFAGPPKFNQTLWPDHCIQNSTGADLHEDLKVCSPKASLSTFEKPKADIHLQDCRWRCEAVQGHQPGDGQLLGLL